MLFSRHLRSKICRFAFKIPYYVTLTFTFLFYPFVRLSYQIFCLSCREKSYSGFPFIISFCVYQIFLELIKSECLSIFVHKQGRIKRSPLFCSCCRVIKHYGFLFVECRHKGSKTWNFPVEIASRGYPAWRLFAGLGITGKLRRTAVRNLGTAAERSSCCIWLKRINSTWKPIHDVH